MRLIIGGYAQGRLSYAMEHYGLTEQDVWDAAAKPLSTWNGQRIIYHVEALVTGWLCEGKNPCEMAAALLPQWENVILITQEVGCGLVPITAEQRAWREAVGRLNTYLARQAETVDRVCCGLGMRIQGTMEE